MFMLLTGGAMAGLGAVQSYNASKAQEAYAVTQYNDSMLKSSMQSGIDVFNNASANVNRMLANQNIAKAAMENLVRGDKEAQRSYEYQAEQVSKQLQTQSQSFSKMAASKLGRNSGTFKLAVEKMKEQGADVYAQQAQAKHVAEQDRERQYQNNLAQRDLMTSNQAAALVPGTPPMKQNHAAAAISGGMQGFGQGISMAANFGDAMTQAFGAGAMPDWMRMPTK